jgi:hypothetical protein
LIFATIFSFFMSAHVHQNALFEPLADVSFNQKKPVFPTETGRLAVFTPDVQNLKSDGHGHRFFYPSSLKARASPDPRPTPPSKDP